MLKLAWQGFASVGLPDPPIYSRDALLPTEEQIAHAKAYHSCRCLGIASCMGPYTEDALLPTEEQIAHAKAFRSCKSMGIASCMGPYTEDALLPTEEQIEQHKDPP